MEISETLPCGPARGDGIRAFPPRCETSGEGILLLVNLEQLGVAAEHLEVANFSGVWLFRPRGLATGGVREGEQGFEEQGGGIEFLAVLSSGAGFLKQRLEIETLLHIERRHIYVEAGNADLVLRQGLGLHRLAVESGAEISGHDHDKQRAINGILRPAERGRLEGFADVLPFLARADQLQHAAADRVLGDIAGVADLGKSPDIATAGARDDLAPVGMIGLGELREEPLQRTVGRVLDFVGEFTAAGFLAAAEEDLRAADDLAKQFLDAVRGDFEMGLDGFAGLDGLGSRDGAMRIERFLGGDLGGNGLPELLVVEAGQIAEQQRAIHPGGAGIVENGFLILIPTIADPQCHLVGGRLRAARRN